MRLGRPLHTYGSAHVAGPAPTTRETLVDLDPSASYCTGAPLLALCTCTLAYVTVPPAAVKAGSVYCRRCRPAGLACELCAGPHLSAQCSRLYAIIGGR